MDIALFLENLDNLSSAEFEGFAVAAMSSTPGADRSACLALCAIGLGDAKAGLRWVEDANRIDSANDFVSFATALVYLQTENVAAAIEPLQKVSHEFVKGRDARVLLATAFLHSGHFADAEGVAVRVSELDDDLRATLLGLRAQCAQARSDEVSARQLYREALTYAPQLEWVRQALKSQTNLERSPSNIGLEVVVI